MTGPKLRTKRPPLPVWRSIGDGYRFTFRKLRQSLVLVLLVQGAVVVVASPMLIGVFDLSLRAAGIASVTDTTVGGLLHSPGGVALTAIAALATVAALLLQAAIFLRVADDRLCGRDSTPRTTARHISSVARRLVRRPSTLLLIPYLLILIPLGHIGANSFLTRWVAVPAFVSDELLKEPTTAIAYTALMVTIWYVNIRLLFVLPLLLLGDDGMIQAVVRSWKLTRWRTLRVLGLTLGAAVPAAAVIAAMAVLAVLPAVVADEAAPAAASVIAAVSFGVLEVAVFLGLGILALVQAQTLVSGLYAARELIDDADPNLALTSNVPRHRRLSVVAGLGAVAAIAVLAIQAIPIMADVSDGTTLAIGHRGFTEGGVENTIPALEAARDAGADLVEMDIQETSDGQWVLMHDPNLTRLAGMDTSIRELTLQQATAITVRDGDHEARIPSLGEYLTKANEIGQPLLIEVKIHGGETADYIDGLLAVLDDNGGADSYIYHTLSAAVVEGLTSRRPDLVVGYIVPLSFGGIPDSPADFFVLEQSAYTSERRARIHDTGRAVFVWTVQDAESMRSLFRENVDGIISDHPDIALMQLTGVAQETGVLQRIVDAIERIVVPMQ